MDALKTSSAQRCKINSFMHCDVQRSSPALTIICLVNGISVLPSSSPRYLAVLIDSDLTFHAHVRVTVARCFGAICVEFENFSCSRGRDRSGCWAIWLRKKVRCLACRLIFFAFNTFWMLPSGSKQPHWCGTDTAKLASRSLTSWFQAC